MQAVDSLLGNAEFFRYNTPFKNIVLFRVVAPVGGDLSLILSMDTFTVV